MTGVKNNTPSGPEDFHGNPVYINFDRNMQLFLEDMKATKNAFQFYSKTDLVHLNMNFLTSCNNP